MPSMHAKTLEHMTDNISSQSAGERTQNIEEGYLGR